MKYKRKLLTAALFFSFVMTGSNAFAAIYIVKIRQTNIAEDGKSAECSTSRECPIPLMLRGSIRNEPVIALVNFKGDGVVSFKFQNFRGFLYAGARGEDKSTELNGQLDEDGNMTTDVTVYYLSAPVRYKTYQLPVVRGEYESIADIEISISPK